ncbi:hypothetical protein KAU43_07895 [candidate division WOR-3 bacterium]|nr:hypothetical protein [candidate division WOR-3 bacterium]
MWLFAQTPYNVEKYTAYELRQLDAKNIYPVAGGVYFKGNKADMMYINYNIRTANRILWIIEKFPWEDEKDLYEKVNNISWERLFAPTKSMVLYQNTDTKYIRDSRMLSLISKDAICDRFRIKRGFRPNISKNNPDIRIFITINKGICYIALDTSGNSLNFRGYRKRSIEAPLRETLAASLILSSGWNKKISFIDPMCGSGTIPIEAALFWSNTPPQILRKQYSFFNFSNFDKDLWDDIRKHSIMKIGNKGDLKIYAGDISDEYIKISKENAEMIGVSDMIHWHCAPFEKFIPPVKRGLIIMNIPYNKRLRISEKGKFYKMIKKSLVTNYSGYKAYILSGDVDSIKFIGLKPSSEQKFFNGPIEVKFIKYILKDDKKGMGEREI